MLTKSSDYFCDSEAVREQNSPTTGRWGKSTGSATAQAQEVKGVHGESSALTSEMTKEEVYDKYYTEGRNIRSVWAIKPNQIAIRSDLLVDEQVEVFRGCVTDGWVATYLKTPDYFEITEMGMKDVFAINPEPSSAAHFAAYPTELVIPPIKVSTSERGCCSVCGAQYARIVDKVNTDHTGTTESNYPEGTTAKRLALLRQAARESGAEYSNNSRSIGWLPTCDCTDSIPVPCMVLDPFAGTSTTLAVAKALGRRSIGIEASKDYCEISVKKLSHASMKPPKGRAPKVDGQMALLGEEI
ncbi:MAG: DNA methyltransferase [Armatimonadota bacterium]|nr:DNA methyltransferase [Armatimonadota bacterium]